MIPENVKHGEELICSYFACRNAGIKFRYCSHCKVPVAKRNFRKRHKHGGDIEVPAAGGATTKKGIPSQITTTGSRAEVPDADGISSQSGDDFAEQHQSGRPPAVVTASANDGGDGISSDRKSRWAALLPKRPPSKNKDEMSSWLSEVMKVSDLENPLSDGGAMDVKDKGTLESKDSNQDAEAKVEDGEIIQEGNGEQDDDTVEEEAKSSIVKRELDKSDSGSGGFAEWKKHKKARKMALPGGIRSEAV